MISWNEMIQDSGFRFQLLTLSNQWFSFFDYWLLIIDYWLFNDRIHNMSDDAYTFWQQEYHKQVLDIQFWI